MPMYTRKLPVPVANGCKALDELSKEIFSNLNPLSLTREQSQSSRISLATTTLHLVVEQSESVATLVLQHRNESAAPILRTMLEAYTRLVYVLLGENENRLAALAYADVVHHISDLDMITRDYKQHDKNWPNEATMYTDEFRATLQARRIELRQAKEHYWNYLNSSKPKEYLRDGELSEEVMLEKISLSKIASRVDYEKRKAGENANARVNYSMVYGQLSKYIHASTLYLSTLRSVDVSGNIRINYVTEEENKEDSLRSLFTAYSLLADTYLEVLAELGQDVKEKRLQYSRATESIFSS